MPSLTLIAEQTLAPVPGGTGRYAAQIGAALAASAPPGWTVRSVTAWHRDVAAARIAGVDGPHRLPAGRRALTALWERGLPPWLRGDSIHATTPLAPARRGVPLVVTVHDAVPWTHPETLTPRGVRWHRAMIGRLARRADAVVVPSNAVADDLAVLLPGVAQRLRVIPHGVTALPPPDDAAARRLRLGLPDGYVLSLSTLEPRKGLDVLVRAMAAPELARTGLAVVGQTGWGGMDLPSVAAAAGLSPDRLHVLGRVSDDDLAAVLAGATVLAVASRAEGFGMPVLEGMAAGVPVVHSAAAALVDVAGGAGVEVPVGDSVALASALAQVLHDTVTADRLRAAGLSRSSEFSWRSAAQQLWRVHAGLFG